MSGFELQGEVVNLSETRVISPKFSVREFVIRTDDKYPQEICFQACNDKITDTEAMRVGDRVELHFNLRGRAWNPPNGDPTRWFNSLDVWRLSILSKAPVAQPGAPEPLPIADDELPF